MARKLEKIKLLFDYKVPSGFLQFGYQKNEIPEIFEYHTRVSEETFEYMDTSIIRRWDKKQQWCKSQYFQEFMSNPHNWECVMTHELYDGQNPQDRFIDSDTHYLIPMESSWWQGDFLEYTLETEFKWKDCFSKKLLKLLKIYPNVRILCVDAREGSYIMHKEVFEKMLSFLDEEEINHKNKIIISGIDDKMQEKIPNDKRITFFNNEWYISKAGEFVTQCLTNDEGIKSDRIKHNYEYDIRHHWEHRDVKKYFNMMNRNSSRLHRPYFVGRLIEEGLLDKGFVSLMTKSKELESAGLTIPNSVKSKKCKTYDAVREIYPLFIDEEDSEKVSEFHNYLSVNTPYVQSLFTIVGETNAEKDFLFITEKTIKPIMNLHPFFVIGNPYTLKKLKTLGFKTFSSIWNEAYDEEENLDNRIEMVIDEVKKLTELSLDELLEKIQKIKNICIYNRELLVKIYHENPRYKNLKKCLQKTVI